MIRIGEVEADAHWRMVQDPRFGYTQGGGRWGGAGEAEEWYVRGHRMLFVPGDRDCSSSICDVWQECLRGTPYEGALSGATYTGNMRRVFVDSGLFEWKPMSFIAEPGDIYLNERDHTAMCCTQYPDVLTEFWSNELGGIVGGQVGDQTGWESRATAYYDFPPNGWDGILHYNGGADYDPEKEDDMVTNEDIEAIAEEVVDKLSRARFPMGYLGDEPVYGPRQDGYASFGNIMGWLADMTRRYGIKPDKSVKHVSSAENLIDVKELAREIVDGIDKELSSALADELAKRLKE